MVAGAVRDGVEGKNEACMWGWEAVSEMEGRTKWVAVAVMSQTPMEKQNKIKNSRQIAFAIKAKHLTYMNVGRKWMFYRALKNNDFSGEASCPYFRQRPLSTTGPRNPERLGAAIFLWG